MELLDVQGVQGAKDDVLDYLLNLVTYDTSLKMARRPYTVSSVYEKVMNKDCLQSLFIRI